MGQNLGRFTEMGYKVYDIRSLVQGVTIKKV